MSAVTLDPDTGALTATETLCITKDGRVVPEDDPEANQVIAAKGQVVPKKLAARYGIHAPKAKEKAVEPPAEPAVEPPPATAPPAPPAEEPPAEARVSNRRGK